MNYSLENVEKFVRDNISIIGDRAEGILERAASLAVRGIISRSSTYEIIQDKNLAEEFNLIVFFNANHIKIGAAVIARNAKEDRKNIPSENFKKALELIQEANLLLKKEWDGNLDNHLASGCYKAVNAVVRALYEQVNACEQDEDYVFGRLVEAILRLADFYGVSREEAFLYSGYFSADQLEAVSSKK